MKILTFKRVIGLAAIGGVAYVHKQRGGTWTIDSLKDTLRYLWSQAAGKGKQVKSEMRDTLDRAASVEPGGRAGVSDPYGSRTFSEYGGRKDDTGRY